MDIFIAGFGTVGQGIAEVIKERAAWFERRFGEHVRIVGALDSSSFEFSNDGLDPELLIQRKKMKGRVGTNELKDESSYIIRRFNYDVLVEVTPTNILTGEPGYSNILTALESGKDVVTSNKGPLALKFSELIKTAEKNQVQLRFEATVGGATPVINLSREILMGEKINSIRGILNGTCNFILHRMREEGLPFAQALKEAQEIGIAERDPTYDIEGVDSACKAAILANAIFNLNKTYEDVKRRGISGITEDAIALAAEERKVIRLIAEISSKRLEVSPRLVPVGHPLSIGGTLNIIQLSTDLAGEITVVGRGAGKFETASAILSDLVALMKEKSTGGKSS
ncbi:MAG: homoserine dehydrogenase [Methanomassiliicoccales archaeon]|jgi:homoserine dehydrogenase|nr:homoserine dehydrogenase [Methanomassiliicoccales archaeon]